MIVVPACQAPPESVELPPRIGRRDSNLTYVATMDTTVGTMDSDGALKGGPSNSSELEGPDSPCSRQVAQVWPLCGHGKSHE
eukprot:2947533-Amphidinium_carterae.1